MDLFEIDVVYAQINERIYFVVLSNLDLSNYLQYLDVRFGPIGENR